MKKLFAFLLTIVLFTASLSGCSGGPAEAPSPSGTAPATSAGDADVAQTGSEPYKIGVFLRFNDEAGTRMRAVLEHYLESLNSQGGVFTTTQRATQPRQSTPSPVWWRRIRSC